MSFERGDPYFDMYSNTSKSVDDEIKSILRRTTDLQDETRHNIFEPSQSSYYEKTENESHWRNVDSRKESRHMSSQESYEPTIANMPIFEDNSVNISSNYQSSKFPKSINAELYAKALAAKSDLGLLHDSSNQSSSALEALRSYGTEFQNSPPVSPYQQGWRSREFGPSHHQSTTAIEQHYHNQTFSPLSQASSKGEFSNELFEQMKSMICSSNPIDSSKPLSGSSYLSSNPIDEPKTSSGSINLIPGFSSIEDEDQFLYGDSDPGKPVEIKDVQTFDSQRKNKEGEWNDKDPQIISEVTSSKIAVADALKSGKSANSKGDKSMTADEFHAINLRLQPNVWKNPSIWDMSSGDDLYSHTESGKRSKKEEALFDIKHEKNKRPKLDPLPKHTEIRHTNIDRGKTSNDHIEKEKRFPILKSSSIPVKQHNTDVTSDKNTSASEQHFDRFQKQSVASDKIFKETILPSSHLDQKSNSKKFTSHVVEKILPNSANQFNLHDQMTESKSKFHYAAELLKTRCTKAVLDAETPAVSFNSPKVTRESSESLSTKFEKNEFAVKQEAPDSSELLTSVDKKTMQKLLINVGQGETFSAKRTVRVKNQPSTSKEAEILGSMVQDFIKQSEMSDKSAFNLQHHRIVRSIKNDSSPKCLLKETSKSPEKKLYPSLGSSKEFHDNLDISDQSYPGSFNIVKSTKKVSKDRSRRSCSKDKKYLKTRSTRSSRSSSSDSNSSRTRSSDSYSSRGRSVGSKSSRRHSRKSQSPKHFSRDSTSPRRGFRASPSPKRSRNTYNPNQRSHIPKHYSQSGSNTSFNSKSSRNPRHSPPNKTSKYYPNDKASKTNRGRSPSFPSHGRRSRSPRKHSQDKYSQKSSEKYKEKSGDRSPAHKSSHKDLGTKVKALKDIPNTSQNLPKKLDQLTTEKGGIKVKSESKISLDFGYDESVNILPSFRVESAEALENISSLPYDESPEPDEKVAELAAFLKEIQQRRKLDNVSQFNDLMENKMPYIDSAVPSAAITSAHLSPQPRQYVEMNRENIDEQMFFHQQSYQYNNPVLTNVAQYPGMNNYSHYPNLSTPDIRSIYNSYNVDVPQQVEPYFPEPDKIKLQVTHRFNKPSSARVCNLKEVPVIENINNIQLLPTTQIQHQKPEIKQTKKNSDSDKNFTSDNKESNQKEFAQKKISETSNKDSQNEELYKKLLEIKDSIQRKIEGTQNDLEELQRIKEKAEKKMRRSRNISDRHSVVQTTELLKEVQEELNILHQQAQEVDKEVTSARLKIAEAKLKDSKPESEVPKISVEPIKFKIANIDQVKSKASNMESKSEMLKASKNEPIKQSEKKTNVPGVKIKAEPVPVIPQVKYSCYDCGSHWCKFCNQQFPSILTMLDHMHESNHKKLDTSVKPWSKGTEIKQEINPFNSSMQPVKGIEFISPVQGYYCSLCKETFPDKLLSEKHLKGHDHTDKYFKFIKENPAYERRYNVSKTAGLSMIYKERMKKAMEEKSLIKKEAEKKLKKMMQREKKFENKVDELDETNLNMSNSPKDHKSSGIKLTLVNENEKTKTDDLKKKDGSSDVRPKQQLVFIGRAPNFKPRTNTKTDLKNRIENSNKRKVDQMQGPTQSVKNISECTESEPEKTTDDSKSIQNLDANQMDENVAKIKSSTKKPRVEKLVDSTLSRKEKSSNDDMLSIKTCTRSALSSESETSSAASNQQLTKAKVVKNKSTNIKKNENVVLIVENTMKLNKTTDSSKLSKTKTPSTTIVEVPLHEIKLPSVPSQMTYETKKSSSKTDPPLPASYPEPIPPTYTYNQNQNAKTPIHKLKQNVLLSEEEQDFLLLGINKADMAPIAIPRPPPSSLIQSHEKSDIAAAHSSPKRTVVKAESKLSPKVVEVLKKNIPPFPPPIQVPPPSIAIQSKNLPPFPPPIQVPPPSFALKNKLNEAILSLESQNVSNQSVEPIVPVVEGVRLTELTLKNVKPSSSMSANDLLKITADNVTTVYKSADSATKSPFLKQDLSYDINLTANPDETVSEKVCSKSFNENYSAVADNIVSIHTVPLQYILYCNEKNGTERDDFSNHKEVNNLSSESSVTCVPLVDKKGSSSSETKEISSDQCKIKIFESVEPKESTVSDYAVVQEANNLLEIKCAIESDDIPLKNKDFESSELSNEFLQQTVLENTLKSLKNFGSDVKMDDIDDDQNIPISIAYDSNSAQKFICSSIANEKPMDISVPSIVEDKHLPKSMQCSVRELESEELSSVKLIEENESVFLQEPNDVKTQADVIPKSMTGTSNIESILKNESVDNSNVCTENEIFTDVKEESNIWSTSPTEILTCSDILIPEGINSEPSMFAKKKRRLEDIEDEVLKTTKELESTNILESGSINEEMLTISANRSKESDEHKTSVSENLNIPDISSNLEHDTEKHEEVVANVIQGSILTPKGNFNSERDANILPSDAPTNKICADKLINTIESADLMHSSSTLELQEKEILTIFLPKEADANVTSNIHILKENLQDSADKRTVEVNEEIPVNASIGSFDRVSFPGPAQVTPKDTEQLNKENSDSGLTNELYCDDIKKLETATLDVLTEVKKEVIDMKQNVKIIGNDTLKEIKCDSPTDPERNNSEPSKFAKKKRIEDIEDEILNTTKELESTNISESGTINEEMLTISANRSNESDEHQTSVLENLKIPDITLNLAHDAEKHEKVLANAMESSTLTPNEIFNFERDANILQLNAPTEKICGDKLISTIESADSMHSPSTLELQEKEILKISLPIETDTNITSNIHILKENPQDSTNKRTVEANEEIPVNTSIDSFDRVSFPGQAQITLKDTEKLNNENPNSGFSNEIYCDDIKKLETVTLDVNTEVKKEFIDMRQNVEIIGNDTLEEIKCDSLTKQDSQNLLASSSCELALGDADSESVYNTVINKVCETEMGKPVEAIATESQCVTLSENIGNKDDFDACEIIKLPTKENTAKKASTVNSQNEGKDLDNNTAFTKASSTELFTTCSEFSQEKVNIGSSESAVKNEEGEMCPQFPTELVPTSDTLMKDSIKDFTGDLENTYKNLEKSFLSADLKGNSEMKVYVKETFPENVSHCSIKSHDSDLNESQNKSDKLSQSLMMEQDNSNSNVLDIEEKESFENDVVICEMPEISLSISSKTDVVKSEIPKITLPISSIACVSNETNEDKTSNRNISVSESEISSVTSEKNFFHSLEKEIILPTFDIGSNNLDLNIKGSNVAISNVPLLEKFDVNDSSLNEDLSNPPVLNEAPENEQKVEDENLLKEFTGKEVNKHSTSESVLESVILKEDTIAEQNLNQELVGVDADRINNLIENFLLFPQENVAQDTCDIKKKEIGDNEKEKIEDFQKEDIRDSEKEVIEASEKEVIEASEKEVLEAVEKEVIEANEKEEIGDNKKEEIEKDENSAQEQKNETPFPSCGKNESDMKYANKNENEEQQISCEKLEAAPKYIIQQESDEQKKEDPELGISKNQQSFIQDSSPMTKVETVKKSHGSNDSDTDEYETDT